MHKIAKVSLFFRILFQCLFILFPLTMGLLWWFAPSTIGSTQLGVMMSVIPQSLEILNPLSTSTKLFGFIIDLIFLIPAEFVLYFLIKLFSLYENGKIFTIENVCYIQYAGYTLLIGELLNPIHQALLTGVLTAHNPPGHRMMTVSISGFDIGLILVALLTILISWVMAEGCKLQEEQKYTI